MRPHERPRTVVRSGALAVLVAWLLSGCSAPGPEPARPAPTIPDSVTLFDEVHTVSRPDPFTKDCAQLTAPVLDKLGLRIVEPLGIPRPCLFEVSGAPVDVLSVSSDSLAQGGANYFRRLWNGRSDEIADYSRRFVLDGKYYAVERSAGKYQTACAITVDTGAPQPLTFLAFPREEREPEIVRKYGDFINLNNRRANRNGLARFMRDACPAVERLAIGSLAAIDSGGGSLVAP